MATLTVSGNEITDATRTTNTQGDGLTSDSSFGIWEATTNLCTNGGFETNVTTNTGTFGPAGTLITQDATQFKFGSKSAKVVTNTGGAGQGIFTGGTGTGSRIPAAAATPYTYSVWLKGNAGGETVKLQLQWYDSTPATLTAAASNVTLTTSWVRYSITATSPANTAFVYPVVITQASATATWFVDAAQFEQKSIATPYVETNGATSSRSAARVQGDGSVFNGTQGWVAFRTVIGFASSATLSGVNANFFTHNNGDNLRWLAVYFDATLVKWVARRGNGTGAQDLAQVAQTFSAGDAITVVASWTATTISASVNGAAFSATASTNIPTLTATLFDIGTNLAAAPCDSNIKWFAGGTGTLTDNDASALNALGNTDPNFNVLPQAAQTTTYWTADTSTYQTQTITRPQDRPSGVTNALTVSGNEITDATRTTATQGDGRATPDGSYGIWEATTNLLTNGGFETDTSTYTGLRSATLTRVTSDHKFGTACCQVVTPGAALKEGIIRSNFAASASTAYAEGAWVKAPAGTRLELSLDWYTGARVFNSTSVTSLIATGGWDRVTVAATSPVGTTSVDFVLCTSSTGANQAVTFYVDGWQFEQKAIATPYVETNGATASRTAARVQAPVVASGTPILSTAQGWVAVRVRMGYASTSSIGATNPRYLQYQDSINERLVMLIGSTTSPQMQMIRQTGGAGNSATSVAQTFASGDSLTVIGAWTATQLGISVNGGAFVTAVNSSIPVVAATTFEIGTNAAGVAIDSDVLWAACGTGALTDANAASIAAYGDKPTSPMSTFPGSCTFLWLADSDFYFVDKSDLTPSGTDSAKQIYDKAVVLGYGYGPAQQFKTFKGG